MMARLREQRGFTLIELMIVVAIIGILAAIAVATLQNLTDVAQSGAEDGIISALNSSAVITFGKVGSTPDSGQVLGNVQPPIPGNDLASLTGRVNKGHSGVAYCSSNIFWSAATTSAIHPTNHVHPSAC